MTKQIWRFRCAKWGVSGDFEPIWTTARRTSFSSKSVTTAHSLIISAHSPSWSRRSEILICGPSSHGNCRRENLRSASICLNILVSIWWVWARIDWLLRFNYFFFKYFSFLPLQTDQTEQEIIELLLGSLRFCDVETVGPHQVIYQIRSGLVYHHLGNIYCRSYWLASICRKLCSTVRRKHPHSTFNHSTTVIHKFNIHNIRFSITKTGARNTSQKTNFLAMALTIAHNSIDQLMKIESLDSRW